MHEFSTSRRVEFADTDMAGIVHFSRFFVFMETAEHEFQRSLGSTVHFQHEGVEIGWPRVEASCRYRSPARLGDELDIHLRILRKGRRSLTYGFDIRCGERAVAEGRLSMICCALEAGQPPRPIPIPSFLADRLEAAPDGVTMPATDRDPNHTKP